MVLAIKGSSEDAVDIICVMLVFDSSQVLLCGGLHQRFQHIANAASGKLVKDGADSDEMRFEIFLLQSNKASTKHKWMQGHGVGVFQEPASVKCCPNCANDESR